MSRSTHRRRGASRPKRDDGAVAAEAPRTPRGLATRAALVRAARSVFEDDGFLDARISDIASVAGVALGSFYNYFDNKEEVFLAVADEVNEEVHHPPSLHDLTAEDEDLVALIARNHRAYLEAYRRNARLMSVMEEVTNISDEFRRERTARAQAVMNGNADAIRALQEAGRADPALDPLLAARSLSVMVSRTAYVTFVLEEETEIDDVVATLTRLWINALKIPVQ